MIQIEKFTAQRNFGGMSTVRTWDMSAEGSVLDVQQCTKGSASLLVASMQVGSAHMSCVCLLMSAC
jgi:hypothetical protein